MPVRIVVSLLRALISPSIPPLILTSIDGRRSSQSPVSCEKPLVSLPQSAVQVIIKRLVHTVLQVCVAVKVLTLRGVFWDGIGGRSITDLVPTHVLQNLFTVVVLVTTRVLIGPLDRED